MTRSARAQAALAYRPARVELLLVAEAPPRDEGRYFYFEDVGDHDSLFRYVVRGVLDREPERWNKGELLRALCDAGVFLIDVNEDPIEPSQSLNQHVDGLVERCRDLRPDAIVLIKTTVFDAAYAPLREAGLPVVAERVPFPGSGRQREFLSAFRRALSSMRQ